MYYDYSKLRGKIIEKFGNQTEFAKQMGWSDRTLSLKLNNKVYWKQPEILAAVGFLELKDTDIQDYFFTIKVQKIEQIKKEAWYE